MIEDIILNFDDYANQLDPDEVYKNSDIIFKQAKGKYIILTIHVILYVTYKAFQLTSK